MVANTLSSANRGSSRKASPGRSNALEKVASEDIGPKLRQAREQAGFTVRKFAKNVGVSPSLISQVERGLAMPSVGTLLAITRELGMELGDLFKPVGPRGSNASGPVQRGNLRKKIRLASGVSWERLTPAPDQDVEFLHVTYDVGSASCEQDLMLRHGGKEYGYLLSGCLGVKIGFDEYVLKPGDSLSFDAHLPHRLWCIGSRPAVVVWAVVQRHGDVRQSQAALVRDKP